MKKEKRETFDEMIDQLTYEVMRDIARGVPLRSSVHRVVSSILFWKDQEGKRT